MRSRPHVSGVSRTATSCVERMPSAEHEVSATSKHGANQDYRDPIANLFVEVVYHQAVVLASVRGRGR